MINLALGSFASHRMKMTHLELPFRKSTREPKWANVISACFSFLVEAQKFDAYFPKDILDLVNWSRIGNSIYRLEGVENFMQADIEFYDLVSPV